jgi:hypothetical protein
MIACDAKQETITITATEFHPIHHKTTPALQLPP